MHEDKIEQFRQQLASMSLEQIMCLEAKLWDERTLNFEMLKSCDLFRQAKERYSVDNICKTWESGNP